MEGAYRWQLHFITHEGISKLLSGMSYQCRDWQNGGEVLGWSNGKRVQGVNALNGSAEASLSRQGL